MPATGVVEQGVQPDPLDRQLVGHLASDRLETGLDSDREAFDIAWVINKGRNGLELIATLVTANVVGEASRIGFGSAMATIMLLISSVFVAGYVSIVMREERRK